MDEFLAPFKEIWQVLWRHKPFLVAVVIIVAILIYVWWSHQQQSTQVAEDTSTDQGDADIGQGSGVPGVIVGTPGGTSGGDAVSTTSTSGTGLPPTLPFNGNPPVMNPAPGPVNLPPRLYTVKAGDTLQKIARKLRTTAKHLWNSNRATLSLASSKHGGKYYDTGKASNVPNGIKLYVGTVLHY